MITRTAVPSNSYCYPIRKFLAAGQAEGRLREPGGCASTSLVPHKTEIAVRTVNRQDMLSPESSLRPACDQSSSGPTPDSAGVSCVSIGENNNSAGSALPSAPAAPPHGVAQGACERAGQRYSRGSVAELSRPPRICISALPLLVTRATAICQAAKRNKIKQCGELTQRCRNGPPCCNAAAALQHRNILECWRWHRHWNYWRWQALDVGLGIGTGTARRCVHLRDRILHGRRKSCM